MLVCWPSVYNPTCVDAFLYTYKMRHNPTHVVYAAGFNHHFGHPAKTVFERYQRGGARAWLTGEAGAIIFTWSSDGHFEAYSWRDKDRRYWH